MAPWDAYLLPRSGTVGAEALTINRKHIDKQPACSQHRAHNKAHTFTHCNT